MADLLLTCPFCDKDLEAPQDLAGQVVKCPSCSNSFRVPSEIPPTPSVPQAAPVPPRFVPEPMTQPHRGLNDVFCVSCGAVINCAAVMCPKCGVPTKNRVGGDAELGQGTLVAGYLLSVFFPLFGGIMGIYAMAKGKVGHGLAMLVLSFFCFFFWMGFLEAL